MVESNADTLLKSKATQQSNETEANPYNAKKDYIDYEQMKANASKEFADANTIAVKKDQPKVVVDSMQSTETEEDTPEEQADKPYQKVDYKKRYDDLKKHYDGRVNSFKSREEELLAEIRANRPTYKAPKSAEEIEAFKKEYPDVYGVVETVAHLRTSKETEDLKQEIKNLKELNQTVNKEKAEARLARMHPDFEQIRESDEFHSWAESQPEAIKGWVYGNATNAELASRAIDLFKQDTGKSKSKPELSGDLVAASEMVKVKNSKEIGYGSKKIWTRSQIAAMSQSEFDKNEKAITDAMSEGRVINDMGNRPSRGSGNPTY
jgi:regulator of replication initiation timing